MPKQANEQQLKPKIQEGAIYEKNQYEELRSREEELPNQQPTNDKEEKDLLSLDYHINLSEKNEKGLFSFDYYQNEVDLKTQKNDAFF